MSKTVKQYGLYAALVGGICFAISHFIDWGVGFGWLEVFGYVSIFASLSFIYFGIRHFRDTINDGLISFKKALLIGLAISAISGLAIGIMDIIYVAVINPDFPAQYMAYALESKAAVLTAEELAIEKAALEEQMAIFDYPGASGLFMFLLVFVIGIIISLISSLVLQRKN